MELTTKYQYTYFIYPYTIEESKYKKYLQRLLRDERCEYKTFEKEKDLDIYNFFLPSIRSYLFPTFELRGDELRDFNYLKVDDKLKIIMKNHVNYFNFNIAQDVQGKVGEENGVFFKVEGIELICFDSGICFFTMKTHIENTNKFFDLLDFNYRFKEINSEFSSLKNFENIKIQTDSFNDIEDISTLIRQITGYTGKNKKEGNENIVNSQFYTFSYVCIETSNWSEKTNFTDIENDFLKFANVLPSNYTSDFNKANLEHNLHIIEKFKYVKTTLSNTASNIFCSGIDTYNYTRLPYEYENQYFYLYVLTLYKKMFLMMLNNEFRIYERIIKLRKNFIDFTRDLWNKEVTQDDTGALYHRTINRALEIDKLYADIQNKYDVIYQDLNIEKNTNFNMIVTILLIFSLIFNTINLIFLMFYLR